MRTHRIPRLLLCIAALLLLLTAAAYADSPAIVQRWERVRIAGNHEGGGNYDIEMTKPYLTYYLLDDNTAWSSDGTPYTWKSSDGEYTLTYNGESDTVFSLSDDGKYVTHYIYGPPFSLDSYRRYTTPSAFKASIAAEAPSFVAGEEIIFTPGASGGAEPYSYDLIVRSAGSLSTINPKLKNGNSFLYIFDQPGEYYAFATALDANLDRSDCCVYRFTIGEAPETSAAITKASLKCGTDRISVAVNEPLRWSITASGGEGDLTHIAYLMKDGAYVSRHEFNGMEGSAMITESGAYQVYARVRDESNGAYSDMFYVGYTTTVDPYDYEIVTDDNGVSTVTLTGYNGHLEHLELPSTIEGLPVTKIAPGFMSANHRVDLVSLVIPEGIVEIGDASGNGAFSSCGSLTSVSFPDSLTSLGYRSFYGCAELTDIEFGANLVSIGKNAFSNCSSLASISIPGSVAELGESAFYNCQNLASVVLNGNLTSIGDGAFNYCPKLTSVVLNDGLVSIGKNAFRETALESLSLPDSVTSIGENCFYLVSKTLKSLKWTAGIPVFPSALFNGFTVLETVVLPEGVTEIADAPSYTQSAFYNCRALTSISLPSTMTKIGSYAFYGCSALTAIDIPEGVTEISQNTFSNCTSLASVSLPKGLTAINSYAFSSCTALTSVSLPDGLTTLADYAFNNSGLTELTLPKSLTSLTSAAVSGLKSTLKSLQWTPGIPVFPSNWFARFSALETVVLPEGVTEIAGAASSSYSAFYNCTALTSVSLPSTLTKIGDYAFYGCNGLTSIDIPKGVTEIGQYVFYGCKALTSVSLPDGLKSVGSYAFYNSALTELLLPDSLTGVTSSTFNGLASTLKSLRWTAGVPVFPSNCFDGCTLLETVILPEGVTEIESTSSSSYGAFNNCTALTSVSLPDTLTKIGNYAFYKCSALTSMELPASVASIGDSAFYNCTELSSVSLSGALTKIGNSAFYGTALTRVYLPGELSSIVTSSFPDAAALVCMSDSVTAESLTSIRREYEEPLALILPADMLVVKAQAFLGSSAELVVLPEGCTTIGSQAFAEMKNLHYLVMPESVTDIAEDAFSGSPLF